MGLGRICLGPLTERVGLTGAVSIYITCSVMLQCAFVMVEGVSASMVLLALNGICLGPMFPSAINLLSLKLPLQAAITAISLGKSFEGELIRSDWKKLHPLDSFRVL